MFGNKLRKLRISKGYSKEYVCKKLNIKTSTLESYEYGKRKPTLDGLIAIKKLYSCTYDFLLTDYITTPYIYSRNRDSGNAGISKNNLEDILELSAYDNGESIGKILTKLRSQFKENSLNNIVEYYSIYNNLFLDIKLFKKCCPIIQELILNKNYSIEAYNLQTNILGKMFNYFNIENKVEEQYYTFLINNDNVKAFIDSASNIKAWVSGGSPNISNEGLESFEGFGNYNQFISALIDYQHYLENIISNFKLI